ncbi:MAG: hypothetical protein ACQEQR_03760 [Pseudomonadota bacterium]
MKNLRTVSLTLLGFALFSTTLSSQASEETRAKLLNSIYGEITKDQPQAVKLLIVKGPAKGCVVEGTAFLNFKRLRYEFNLAPINCIKNGEKINVGTVVRGQHNVEGTMANSGMGRSYLISNKGVTVTLAHQ